MVRGLSAAARAALVFGGLLYLLLCSQQASASWAAGPRSLAGQEGQSVPPPWVPLPAQWLQLLSRARRSTPFWRTVGSKPLGAHCARGLECITQACRNGRCAELRVKS